MSWTWAAAQVPNQKVEVKTGRWRGDPAETELNRLGGSHRAPGDKNCRVDLTGPAHRRPMFPSGRPSASH